MKYVLILGLITFVAVAAGSRICAGCPHKREGAEIEESAETLKNSLSKLAAKDGPNYKFVKINSAFVQVVAGRKDIINADIEDQQGKKKTCDIEIWSKPRREDGIQVKFDCPGEEPVTKVHSA